MAFNLQEYILFRTEIKRELTNAEVDTNFQMVSNPWVDSRVYEIGNIVYHPVIVDDPATTGEDQVLAWWRANIRTTQGVFDTSEWDMIGGIGSGNINIQGANSFGKINVNSTSATGPLQTGTNALITSVNPNDTFNLIAGAGMQLQYNVGSKSIVLVNTGSTGEANTGANIGLGVGQQDIYAGMSGTTLDFYGLQATNTGGAALTISTNLVQNNVEYNFDEGLVNLAAINSGAPLITMLSDVSAVPPNVTDVLQWTGTVWSPTSLASLGNQNIYSVNGNIAAQNRIVSLNSLSGYLSFDRLSATGGDIGFSNAAADHLMRINIDSAGGTSAIQYSANLLAKWFTGYYGTDGSFGINQTALSGLQLDALSISTNNELYIPQIATDTLTTVETYRIPLVDTTTGIGRFDSSSGFIAQSFADQSGSYENVEIQHDGRYILTGKNTQNNIGSAISLRINSEHDFVAGFPQDDGYGLYMSYKTPSDTQGFNALQWMDEADSTYIGSHVQTQNSAQLVAKKVGSNISLDNAIGTIINVGQIIAFTDMGAGGVNPQRVGLYSNVVDSEPNGSGEQVLTDLVADSGTWAGYFVGCVNIDQGGLVLPSTTFANRPLCNDVSGGTVSDRTLWINSANGHLYRGTTDVEASGGGGGATALSQLTDVNLTGLVNDQLLVYNGTSGNWENATLAPYNLNAIALTSGGASIQLSDGSGTSDVDLLPGTNISFSVNSVTDEITINATGAGGTTYQAGDGIDIDTATNPDTIAVDLGPGCGAGPNLEFNGGKLDFKGVHIEDEGVAVGTYPTINFIGADVLAQDSGDPCTVNVYIPSPTFASHWNTNDGTTTGTVAESNLSRHTVRISTPTTVMSGDPFNTGGWAGADHPATDDSAPTFGPAQAPSGLITGFSGTVAGDAKMVVTMFDADGVTVLATFDTSSVNAMYQNQVFTSIGANAGITVTVTNWAADVTKYKANIKVDVNTATIFTTNTLDGGKYRVECVMTTDTATDGAGTYTYTQDYVFYDTDQTAPSISGAMNISETAGSVVTKFMSGVEYYNTNSEFTINLTGMDDLNANTQGFSNSGNPNTSRNFLINGSAYGLAQQQLKAWAPTVGSMLAWSNLWNNTNASFQWTQWPITFTNYRFRNSNANGYSNVSDPWNLSLNTTSPSQSILVDTVPGAPTNLGEDFDDESERLIRDAGGTNTYLTWDSKVTLASTGSLGATGASSPFSDACVVGDYLVRGDKYFLTSGVINGNLTTYSPWTNAPGTSGANNPDYSTYTATPVYHRKFYSASGNTFSNVRLYFGGDAGSSGTNGWGDALTNSLLKVYVRRDSSPNGGSSGFSANPLNVHGLEFDNAQFDDGVSGVDTWGSSVRTIASNSATPPNNFQEFTWGSWNCTVGFWIEIQIIDPTIEIDYLNVEMQYGVNPGDWESNPV